MIQCTRESPTRPLRLITNIDDYLNELSEQEFKRVHRVSRSLFYRIAEKIKTGPTFLSMTLRFLAGSRMLDISHMYGYTDSYIYRKFHDVIALIVQHFPITQEENFKSPVLLAETDSNFRHKSCNGVMQGCIGAVDGLIIGIQKPNVKDPVAYFTTRYKKYGVNVQAICDSRRKFTFLSVRYGARMHDSKALELSNFSEDIAKNLPAKYWIAGDAAYRSSNFPEIVTPFDAGIVSYVSVPLVFFFSTSTSSSSVLTFFTCQRLSFPKLSLLSTQVVLGRKAISTSSFRNYASTSSAPSGSILAASESSGAPCDAPLIESRQSLPQRWRCTT
eukprot:g356.t1